MNLDYYNWIDFCCCFSNFCLYSHVSCIYANEITWLPDDAFKTWFRLILQRIRILVIFWYIVLVDSNLFKMFKSFQLIDTSFSFLLGPCFFGFMDFPLFESALAIWRHDNINFCIPKYIFIQNRFWQSLFKNIKWMPTIDSGVYIKLKSRNIFAFWPINSFAENDWNKCFKL